MSLIEQIDRNNCPVHIAIIMDGNGRWAKNQGQNRLYGHASGVEAIREILKAATELGVKYLTLYAFSTENWNRPKEEVDGLMDLMVRTIANEVEDLNRNNVKLNTIGATKGLPASCQATLKDAIAQTAKNTGIELLVALNYSARWELLEATKKIGQKIKENTLKIEDIDAAVFENELCTRGIPDPDLLIRTSGEYRISNFLLWQIAYSELYFSQKLWPEFRKDDFFQAIIDYQNRERRFGQVSEQLKK